MPDLITDQRDLVSEVREALAKATPPPWVGATPPDDSADTQAEYVRNTFHQPDAHASHCHTVWAPKRSQERGYTAIIGFTGDGPTSYENRELIAHAPEWLAALCDEVERLRETIAGSPDKAKRLVSLVASSTRFVQIERNDAVARAEEAEAAVERVRALANQWYACSELAHRILAALDGE